MSKKSKTNKKKKVVNHTFQFFFEKKKKRTYYFNSITKCKTTSPFFIYLINPLKLIYMQYVCSPPSKYAYHSLKNTRF